MLPLAEARANKVQPAAAYTPHPPQVSGIIELNNYPLDRVIPYISWNAFMERWEAEKSALTLADARALLEQVTAEGLLQLRGVIGIFPAAADGDDIIIGKKHRFCFLRSQQQKAAGKRNPCLADFVAPAAPDSTPANQTDWIGLFALSAGFGLDASVNTFRRHGDDYNALLLASLANALTEAFTEEAHLRVRREWWGYAPHESLSSGIRPAFGYPACPDHEDKRIAGNLLEAETRCGFTLTDTAMIVPAASTCGMFFASPAAHYFSLGTVGEDQLSDWAARKGISAAEARRRAGMHAEIV
jgi:5-methyltetrahydrofolate--homocysteine methyltransferase